jgi:GTP cyclohydrolase FolE2
LIQFTKADIVRLLRLKNTQEVESLIRARDLDISAYTARGRPLFNADVVRRLADRLMERRGAA